MNVCGGLIWGEIWLIIGTESGFEGITTVYYTRVNVVFSGTSGIK